MQEKAEYESLCDYNDNEGFNMVCIAYFYPIFFKQLLKREGGYGIIRLCCWSNDYEYIGISSDELKGYNQVDL